MKTPIILCLFVVVLLLLTACSSMHNNTQATATSRNTTWGHATVPKGQLSQSFWWRQDSCDIWLV